MSKALKIISVVVLIFVLMFSSVQILNKLIPWWNVPRFSMEDYNLEELPVCASGIDIGEITDIDTLLTKTQQVWTDTFLPIVGERDIGKTVPAKEDIVVYYDPDTDCWLVREDNLATVNCYGRILRSIAAHSQKHWGSNSC